MACNVSNNESVSVLILELSMRHRGSEMNPPALTKIRDAFTCYLSGEGNSMEFTFIL